MLATAQQPIKRFELDYQDIASMYVDRPFDAAILEMSQLIKGWDWYTVEMSPDYGECGFFCGILFRGEEWDIFNSVEVYRYIVEITPCLVTVEVYQAEQ